MLVFVINLITILLLSTSISLLLKDKLFKSILTATLIIPLFLMIVAMFFDLHIALIVLYFAVLALSIYVIYNNKSFLYEYIVSNRSILLIYVVSYFFFILVNYNRPVTFWDDFSHWARVVKNMNVTYHLNRAEDTYLLFKQYPPYVSLFLYFFNYGKVFVEWKLHYAQSLFTFSLVFPIVGYFYKKNKTFYNLILYFLALSIPSCISQIAYISLFVDNIMGLLLGYAMIEYLFNKNESYCFFNISLSLIALALTKDAGIALVIIFALIILMYNMINNLKKKSIKDILLYILYLVVLPLIFFFIYRLYLKMNNIGINQVAKYTNTFLNLNTWYVTTVKNFYHNVFEYNFGNIFKLTIINSIVIAIIIGLIISIYSSDDRKFSYIIIFATLGFIVYLALLLITYVCCFGEYESITLASFDRYVTTFYLFLIYVIISVSIYSFDGTKRLVIILCVFSLVFNTIQGLGQITYGIVYNKNNSIGFANEFKNKCNYIEKFLEDGQCYSVISCEDYGANAMKFDYYLGPRFKQYICSEPGIEAYNLWVTVVSPDDYIKRLVDNEVKIIYINNCNENFKNNFSEIFMNSEDIKNNGMFFVNSLNKLERVGD